MQFVPIVVVVMADARVYVSVVDYIFQWMTLQPLHSHNPPLKTLFTQFLVVFSQTLFNEVFKQNCLLFVWFLDCGWLLMARNALWHAMREYFGVAWCGAADYAAAQATGLGFVAYGTIVIAGKKGCGVAAVERNCKK